jgi:hypothetical protein
VTPSLVADCSKKKNLSDEEDHAQPRHVKMESMYCTHDEEGVTLPHCLKIKKVTPASLLENGKDMQ